MIRRRSPDAPIIYVTRSSDHALDAYKLCACRYLLKPLRYAEIMSALDFALIIINGLPKKPFTIKNGGSTASVYRADIIYIENNVRIMKYYMRDGKVMTGIRRNTSFEDALSELLESGDFIQTHKSFVVNMKYIASMRKDSILLDNDVSIPISRKHIQEVHETYARYISGGAGEGFAGGEKNVDI